MGQTAPPQWWEVIVGILSIPATIFGIISSFYIIQKAMLEKQKLKLETRKLELEILEKEKKLRSKGKPVAKPANDNKLKSVLEKVLVDIQVGENRITNFLMIFLSPFKTYKQGESAISINSQRVAGSLAELIFLLLFIYTDTSQVAQTLALLYQIPIPAFFANTTIPLFISSAGVSIILGLIIGDLLGFTNLTRWSDLREINKKHFLAIILSTMVTSVVLSSLLAIRRLGLIDNSSSGILLITALAESLYIVPVLITTSLLFHGVAGILVLLALPFVLLRFPISIFRKSIERIIYYVSD